MVRTIALEEHFTTKELAAYAAGISSIVQPGVWAEALRLLLDVTASRLSAMDDAGLDVQVLSLNAPGIQAEKDASVAVSRAKAVNDLLAETIATIRIASLGLPPFRCRIHKLQQRNWNGLFNSLA